MKILKPDYYVSNFKKVSLDRLKKEGIRLLLCDIDNTLVSSYDPDSNQEVIDFVKKVKKAGLQIGIVSNSRRKRAKRFAKNLHIDEVYYFSMKPLPYNFIRAMRVHNVKPNETAILGDQLFTDILGGNLSGLYTILTKPISNKDKLMTVFNRKMEYVVFKVFEKKYGFDKEVFDDETL